MAVGDTPQIAVRLPPELLAVVRRAFPELADLSQAVVVRVALALVAKLAQDAVNDPSGTIGAAFVAGVESAPDFSEAEIEKFREILPVMLRTYGTAKPGPKPKPKTQRV